jgi:predicted nucleic acid-binding protein
MLNGFSIDHEVYRKIARSVSEEGALSAVAVMSQHPVVDLTAETALTAADLSIAYSLAMADAVVLAHACLYKARLATLDNDFSEMPDVVVIR